MKKLTKLIEVTYYKCDHCNFNNSEEIKVRRHEITHKVPSMTECEEELYYFESEKDANEWLDLYESFCYIRYREVRWDGVGWYKVFSKINRYHDDDVDIELSLIPKDKFVDKYGDYIDDDRE